MALLPLGAKELRSEGSEGSVEGRYAATIETRKGYVSGICILRQEDGQTVGSLFNEFGITALSFVYNPQRDKVKLLSVLPMLNKWYIRRVLRADLRHVIHRLQQGETLYEDTKYKITYRFTPMTGAEDDTPDTDDE